MKIDDAVRDALRELADDAPPGDGLATTALRRARRHRVRMRATVAAGVAVVAATAVPVGAGVLSEHGSSDASDVLSPAAPGSDVIPAPASRELADDELAEAFANCLLDIDGEQLPGYDGWEPVFGITIGPDAAPGVPTTWVAARRGEDYRADCGLDASGELVAGGGEYGLKSTPELLYALVDGQEGGSVGRYVEPVATVTVQYEDGPEQEAVVRGGFWFFPIDEMRYFSENIDEGATPEEVEQGPRAAVSEYDLIGVPMGYVFRGYNSTGKLIYDSSKDGPSIDDCYADPTGTEIVGGGAGYTEPSECVPTHQWRPLG